MREWLPRCGSISPSAVLLLLVLASAMTPARADDASPAKSKPGTLFICGGGKLPPGVLGRFCELAQGSAGRLVLITTASDTAGTPEVEVYTAYWRTQAWKDLQVVHTRNREEADTEEFCAPLTQATAVWFLGGKQARLVDTYRGTRTEKALQGVLDRGGVIGGTSAGAAVMSPVMIRRGDPDPELGEGFGYLSSTIVDQHFIRRNRQGRLLKALGQHPGFVGIGIDEGTALEVCGEKATVHGESDVVICLPPLGDQPALVESHAAGTALELPLLRAKARDLAMKK